MKIVVAEGEQFPVLYIGEEETGIDGLMYQVSDIDWNRDLSPWYSQKIFRGGEDFAGKADELLQEILAMDLPEKMIIAGYSLAGLFALYSCTLTDRFIGCVSASSSLWYPGFVDYLKTHPLHSKVVYFSLGDKEKNSRNPILSTIEDKTKEVYAMVSGYADCTLIMNPGNHFSDTAHRVEKGIDWVRQIIH